MAVLTPLKAISITAGEQAAVQLANGGEDPTGQITAVINDVAEVVAQLTRIAALMPAGANLTSINTIISTLS